MYVTRDLTGDTGPGVKLTDSEMVFPFASDVSTFDSDGDGGLDRIYAVDVGGQVWRVDMSPDLSETGSLNVSAERLANLSFNNRFNPTAPPAAADERRLFYRPAVVRVRDDVTFSSVSDYDIVVVATGERPNPLETAVQNRIYAFRDTFITPNDDLGGNFYPDGSGSADPWTVSDLFNLSSINDPQGADLSSLNGAKGWYIDLPDSGEKALSAAEVIAGKLFITTYLPAGVVSGSSCSLAEGNGRLWGLNVLNAAALFNWDGVGDSDNLTKSDRYYTLGPGIPSSAVPIFQPEGVTLLIGGGGIESVDPDVDIPRFETYWYQQ